MIISLDRYKKNSGGSGGGGSVSTDAELSIIDFANDIKNGIWNGKYHYVNFNLSFDSSYYGSFYTLCKFDKIIPYIWSDEYYSVIPFTEQTYIDGTPQNIIDTNGYEVKFVTNSIYDNDYGKYIGSKYFWKYNNSIEIQYPESYLGKICSKENCESLAPFDYSSLSEIQFGFPDENGNYNKPFNYYDEYISSDIYLSNAKTPSADRTYFYDKYYNNLGTIKGILTIKEIPNEYIAISGDNFEQIGNSYITLNTKKMVVYDNWNAFRWFCNSLSEAQDKLISSEEFLSIEPLVLEDFMQHGYYYKDYYCKLNIGTDLKFKMYSLPTSILHFNLCPNIKMITIDANEAYNKFILLDFGGCKNLKKLDIQSDYTNKYKLASGYSGGEYGANRMFYGCTSLTSIPQLDTSNVTSMMYMFYGCTSLTSIPELDATSVTSISGIFDYVSGNYYALKDFGGLKNLKVGDTNFIKYCRNLTVESLMNIINKLDTVSGQTLSFGQTNLDKLTPEQIAVATAKGWTLTA